ncbi:MAG: hypothetical protein Q6373_005295 [Candidatus Sigynarchaeota archaeon]
MAQELDRIRSTSLKNEKAIDAWWREFCGTLASLHDLYLALMHPSPENEPARDQARDLVKNGTRQGSELFQPLAPFICQLNAEDFQIVSGIATDLFDSIILKLYSLLGNA